MRTELKQLNFTRLHPLYLIGIKWRLDRCIVLKRNILQRYTIKQKDKHFFTSPLIRLYQFTQKKLLNINPLIETPSICNGEDLLSHIIRDITLRAYIINQQVGK